jgi:inhibitor of KinA sporulation pathway (predicted exonuclease)
LDTSSIKRDADILRVLIVNLAGEELYNQIVRPLRHPNEPNEYYTKIGQEQLDSATTLAEQWDAITEVLKRRYTLAYGHDFVQERLDDNARAYGLLPIYLVGDCLHNTASQYTRRTSINLASACTYVGFPQLYTTMATQRAQAQISLLKAIADGQPKRQASPAFTPVIVYDDPDLDDHPF